MIGRVKREPSGLTITFERDGEEPVLVSVTDGTGALRRAVEMLLANRKLQAGDRLTVEAAD
jgi:hypothetical protein